MGFLIQRTKCIKVGNFVEVNLRCLVYILKLITVFSYRYRNTNLMQLWSSFLSLLVPIFDIKTVIKFMHYREHNIFELLNLLKALLSWVSPGRYSNISWHKSSFIFIISVTTLYHFIFNIRPQLWTRMGAVLGCSFNII